MIDILDFIFKNQITAESWEDIQTGVSAIISDHDKLIRYMAQYVLDGNAGGGDERRNLLGIYYDEVQDYVTWVCRMADEIWAGKWGNGTNKEKRANEVNGHPFRGMPSRRLMFVCYFS